MIRTLIIEDEYPAAERLEKLLARIEEDVEVLAVIGSVKDALSWFATHELPDLILSDIQLSDGISFEIFQKLDLHCPIIFTTAYDEYAIRAFKVQSVDYLLKPIKQTELSSALAKFGRIHPDSEQVSTQEKLQTLLASFSQNDHYKKRLLVQSRESFIPVSIEDVAYFYTKNEVVYVMQHDGQRYVLDQTLDSLAGELNPTSFFRLNRQFIASLSSVRKVNSFFNGRLKLTLNPVCDDDVIVSREKSKPFKVWLGG
ncbi:MAG: LytR/AlgR family response regulator transcription factor [Bacteroidia bacterium]